MSYEVLNIATLQIGQRYCGIACLKKLVVKKTSAGADYGILTAIKGTDQLNMKIWASAVLQVAVQKFAELENKPFLAALTLTTKDYQGMLDCTVEGIDLDLSENTEVVADFLPTLNCDALYAGLRQFINDNLSDNWCKVITKVLNIPTSFMSGKPDDGTTLEDLYKVGWAASGYHDAIRGGLVNHTRKMLRIARIVFENNPHLSPYKDLIYTGIVLHDIGKVQEMQDGCYLPNSFVSHRVFGLEYLAYLKKDILQLISYGEYVRLESIIIGHHDRFDTPATTVWAYIVHLIDMLDSQVTNIEERYVQNLSNNAVGEQFIYGEEGKHLYY